ncbi:MAG: hypothetical protein H7281_08300 [Bacteriovorax sp.]|nr:hypothetical protein [Bacteriovorax sp.]
MKILVILSVIALSLTAGAADLLTYKGSSRFSPIPSSNQVSVSENGKITRVKQVRAAVTREVLGQLSANAVQSLKDQIEGIADNAKLVDPNPKAPRCMDAPSSSVSVNKGGKEITITTRNSCHTSTVEDSNAYSLISLITGLNSL